jgi:hypothetical protein
MGPPSVANPKARWQLLDLRRLLVKEPVNLLQELDRP